MSVEPSRQFVDTNVIVYAHDDSAGPKHDRARAVLVDLWRDRTGCLSVQILQEVYVTLTAKVPKRLEASAAAAVVDGLSRWRVHSPGSKDVLEAIALHRRHNVAFWDAMIIWSARQLNCSILWSEDLNPGQVYEDVRVLNPFAT